MKKKDKRLEDLLSKYLDRLATKEEIEELWRYVDDQQYGEAIEAQLAIAFEEQKEQDDLAEVRQQRILNDIFEHTQTLPVKSPLRLWPQIAAAASILLVLSMGLFYLKKTINHKSMSIAKVYANDVPAGTIGATLTLASGEKITLSNVPDGFLAKQTGVSISKTKDGLLIYKISGNKSSEISYNTLSTAKGQQYQVILPDESKVWLNASSSITFPASFKGLPQRKVKLLGEAYFVVVHNEKQPFLVQSGVQVVEDIGTAFNINAYEDEPVIKTTLIEGSAKVNGVTLVSGQQSNLEGNRLHIRRIKSEDALDWKSGYFQFNNESLESIMRKMCRWYNMDIRYADPDLKSNTYLGTVSRSDNVSKLLNMLERTGGVQFDIKGRTITARRNESD